MTEREIIAKLVNAMQEAQQHGNVDHLDCAPDSGMFWYEALVAGEAYLNGDNVDAVLTSYRAEYWPPEY
jgi:hypothetical protein